MTTYWCDNSEVKTHYLDAFSVLFPAWEQAWAAVVHAHLNDVEDLALRKRMLDFIAQETAHGKAHAAHNRRIGQTSAEAAEHEKIQLVLKRPKMKIWLAAMVSIEHIASCLSRDYLARYGNRTGREYALFRWHSIEELEHKSLAIDLWDALGYPRSDLRAHAVKNLRYVLRFVYEYMSDKLQGAGGARRVAGGLYCGWHGLTVIAKPFYAVTRSGFHPTNTDDTKLLARFA